MRLSRSTLKEMLASCLLPTQYSLEPIDRECYGRDLSTRSLLRLRGGQQPIPPEAVVWPREPQQLTDLITLARVHSLGLVSFGAGSGVVHGIVGGDGMIAVDLKGFDRLTLDTESNICEVGAGVLGETLERWLNARGYSLGHFPSSIYCSTVGGWAATRSAGQLSSRYGKIEDQIRWIEGVDGNGRFRKVDTGRHDLLGLLIGSEGALMILTGVALHVHPLPGFRALRGARFGDIGAALGCMKAIMQAGLRPAILRLYDPYDSLLSGHAGHGSAAVDDVEEGAIGQAGLERVSAPPSMKTEGMHDLLRTRLARWGRARGQRGWRRLAGQAIGLWPLLDRSIHSRVRACRLIFGFEGDEQEVRACLTFARQQVLDRGGADLGPAAGRHWLERRYAVSYKLSRILDAGLWADTFEVATTWSKLSDLYLAVRTAVRPHALCLAHFSHAYPEGCSIYFTLVGGGEHSDAEQRHSSAWHAGLAAARQVGAVLSHHHGIGRLKADAMVQADGAGGRVLREELKRALDPDTVLNPGVLGLVTASVAGAATVATGDLAVAHASGVAQGSWRGLLLDRENGMVCVSPDRRLSCLAAALWREHWELGATPAGWGRWRVRDAMRAQDPRLIARLVAVEGTYRNQPVYTPQAPRAATGPDLRCFFLGRAVEDLHGRRIWLGLRRIADPVTRCFRGELQGLLTAGWNLVEEGAVEVKLEVSAGLWTMRLEHDNDRSCRELWRARIEAQAGLEPLAPLRADSAGVGGARRTIVEVLTSGQGSWRPDVEILNRKGGCIILAPRQGAVHLRSTEMKRGEARVPIRISDRVVTDEVHG